MKREDVKKQIPNITEDQLTQPQVEGSSVLFLFSHRSLLPPVHLQVGHMVVFRQRKSHPKTFVLRWFSVVEQSNLNPNHCPLGHLWRQSHRK